MKRRNFFKVVGAASAVAMLPKLSYGAIPNVVVVGGGPGGAAVAKYLKTWGLNAVNVTLINKASSYVTCMQSNLVITGAIPVSRITRNYNTLRSLSYGVNFVQGAVTGITPGPSGGTVSVQGRSPIPYDFLILAPGVQGIPVAGDPTGALSYWEGSKALDLKRQLDAIPNGGTFFLTIPSGTYKGALAPYGRTCAVADYLQSRGCKVIVLDAHADIVSQKNDFVAAFRSFGSNLVPGTNNFTGPTIDYYAGVTLNSVNIAAKTLDTSMGLRSFNAANVIPAQKAALDFATALLAGGNFAPVNSQTFQSTVSGYSRVYIIGDAQGTALPKSGNIAADQAKIVASAITRQLAGRPLETSLAVSAVQFNAIRSTSRHTAVYAHSGFQWNATAHTLPNPANTAQSANSWVASGAFLNANGTDSNAGNSATATQSANISGENYSQGLTWLDSLLADCYGV